MEVMETSRVVWRKATRTTENGGDCVEVASILETIVVRDSKDPHGPTLTMSYNDFRHLTKTLKNF
ncbi:DUF397 domain-containing protein [Actinomadura sp. 9N215]|uniref:DUF397 domain-containing protein n=1 Tax=Actinomadura sp. 9N215 TaxID=3375150 RepID=UPI0037A64304